MAVLPEYLADVAREMKARSSAIRRDFASHRLSAGENREDLVAEFLKEHFPMRFGINSGMIISHHGVFSNQADLIVVDALNNAPLYAASRNQLWPAEAVYALVEVKTALGLAELRDAVNNGQRFKSLQRKFCEAGQNQRIRESLFVIWSFESARPGTLKQNLIQALEEVPRVEQPDLIVVPDRLVARAGSYLELSKLGQPGSPYRTQLHAAHGASVDALIPEVVEIGEMGENALLAWYVWFDSWLRQAGPRLSDPKEYLSPAIYGRVV